MKKLVSNNLICVGNFCGPDIEEGTFHEDETATDVSHKGKTQKCPCCPPIEFHGVKVPDDSNKDDENDAKRHD